MWVGWGGFMSGCCACVLLLNSLDFWAILNEFVSRRLVYLGASSHCNFDVLNEHYQSVCLSAKLY